MQGKHDYLFDRCDLHNSAIKLILVDLICNPLTLGLKVSGLQIRSTKINFNLPDNIQNDKITSSKVKYANLENFDSRAINQKNEQN